MLSKSEAAYVAGLEPAVVERAIDRARFARPYIERRPRGWTISPQAVLIIAADQLLAKDVAAAVRTKLRRHLEAELLQKPVEAMGVVIVPETFLPLKVDLTHVAGSIVTRLRARSGPEKYR
ncbi:hypothetical protein [Salinarimonas ramus]|uniref:Uncharacterized protein n=1 Tax=Salinarimonas ramus TaxID=690164 RepID=A0A917QE50_9HYPH|nr:hypothetical protein [Salinarimonas ramus]GGK46099.1 hypothetical protein GCM10011322_36490 [Salinarimonas ramus]